jgi:hypothetical protein
MKSVIKHSQQKGLIVSYYLKLNPSLPFENLFLLIGDQKHPLHQDKDLFFHL